MNKSTSHYDPGDMKYSAAQGKHPTSPTSHKTDQQGSLSREALRPSSRSSLGTETIQAWLINKLAEQLAIEPANIDIAEPFASYGLESVDMVGLSGDLELWLGRELAPTLLYDYPTIASLACYLAQDPNAAELVNESGESAAVKNEPIAIIGIGCRFPGAQGPGAFWRLLCDGVDAISEVPAVRWDAEKFYDQNMLTPGKMNTRWGGFLPKVNEFDAAFFGISPREAERMDPQQRLLLEVVWEALEDAGQVPERLSSTRTSVFIGIANSDYSRMQFSDPELSDAYAGTGSAFSVAANRISYLFDWRGPSMAIDTACSSSLVAVHLACQSLLNGESTLAVAGGVNLILSPELTVNFTKAGFMAPDGRCKAFDASADGYVRGEGVGVVVLKPLSQALAEDDPIYAIIRGSAINQDGRSNGLTAPNRQSQEAVLREAYQHAGVKPGCVQYVEAHGTGTALGDPIEAKALGSVLALARLTDDPCLIGSVKTNIGHLEAAAGIAGLIKVALSLKHSAIPPGLHYSKPNPYIPFDELPLRVQTALTPWPSHDGPALAGVSSFGFGGTNAHVVLAEAPHVPIETEEKASIAPYLLPLSARSATALHQLARQYQDYLATEEVSLSDICYTAGTRRDHHDYRMAVVARTSEELSLNIEQYLKGEAATGAYTAHKETTGSPQLVFIFPGQGSQWPGMGQELLAREPVFAEALSQCEQAMKPHVDWSLLDVLTKEQEQALLERIDVIQPTLFAIEVALAALWRSWGIVPAAVAGHSMGEVAAAYVAGALSLEDAVRVICRRSKLLRRVSGQGAMALVELSLQQAEQVVAHYSDRLSVAVSNSPRTTVLSGETAALEEVLHNLEQHNVFCRRIKVDVASHSPQMDSLRDELLSVLDGLDPQISAIPMYSTVTGALCTGREFDATYWVRNLREPVRFASTIQQLAEGGHTLFLEMSPHPILLPAIAEGLRHSQHDGFAFPSLRRAEDERGVLLESLGALYAHGYPVDWRKLYPKGTCVTLPTYPWQREHFWVETHETTQRPRGTHRNGVPGSPLLGEHMASSIQSGVHYWETVVSTATLPYLNDHRVQGQVVVPAAAYLEMALTAAKETFGAGLHLLEEVTFTRMLVLTEEATQTVQVVLSDTMPGIVTFQISSCLSPSPSNKEESEDRANKIKSKKTWTLHASGTIQLNTHEKPNTTRRGGSGVEKGGNPWVALYPPSENTAPTTRRGGSGVEKGGDPWVALGMGAGTEDNASFPAELNNLPAGFNLQVKETISGPTFYQLLQEQGLEYGPSFQAIEQIWQREGEAIALLHVPEEVLNQAHSYQVHPVLLDACFQVFGATLSQTTDKGSSLTRKRGTYLPVGLRSLRVHTYPDYLTGALWSHVLLKSQEIQGAQPTWTADLELLDTQGHVLLEVRGLRVQQLASETHNPQQKELSNWLYTLNWHPLAPPAPRHHKSSQELEIVEAHIPKVEYLQSPPQVGTWLMFTDNCNRAAPGLQLQILLQARGERCITVSPGKRYEQLDSEHYLINPASLPDYLQLLENVYAVDSPLCAGIVHLWSLESASTAETTLATLETAQQLGCTSVLHLVQALSLIGWRDLPQLWLVTQGTQAIQEQNVRAGLAPALRAPALLAPALLESASAAPTAIAVAQAPLWGLGRTIAHEHPRLQCTLVDLSPTEVSQEEIAALAEALQGKDQENQLVLRGKTRYVARLERYVPQILPGEVQRRIPAGDQPFRLEIDTPGILDHLMLRATTRREPGPGEVEIAVVAASLNFLDVLKALGIFPGQGLDAPILGGECAGRVTALGTNVVELAVGDEVVALAGGCIGTHVTTSAHCVVAKPTHLSFEQAAAIPVVFLTAYYALHSLARITKGERILIHSAAGGTGLAAVQLAQFLGAEIFATAGSTEKREYLRSLGIQHVMDSRSLTFAEEVLAATQDRGVDVVLNSLTGAAMAKSLSVLAPYGRFIELGKKDIYQNSLLELAPFRKNLSYFALDLAGMVRERPMMVSSLLEEVMQLFKAGLLKPPPTRVFPIPRFVEAFHTMAQAKHIGKLVISLQNRTEALITPTSPAIGPIRTDSTYLITGGLGAIGLKVAQWLVEQGAKHLVLLNRSGASAIEEEHLTPLTRDGAYVRVAQVDVRQTEQVASLLAEVARSMPPLRGIFHAAGVLDDGLMLNLDEERFQKVLEPKMLGAWNLHALTQTTPLDFFVLFSSAASLLGSPGQSNYAAANAFLDALAHHRQALNLPALSINWGPWAMVGLAATQANRGDRLAMLGIESLSPAQGIEALVQVKTRR